MAESKSQRAFCLEFECLYDRYVQDKLAQVSRILVPTGTDSIETPAEDLSHEKERSHHSIPISRSNEGQPRARHSAKFHIHRFLGWPPSAQGTDWCVELLSDGQKRHSKSVHRF